MRYGFIYETTNLENGKKYIGKHKRSQDPKDPDDSWYLGSSRHIKNSFKKAYDELGNLWYTRYSRIILEDCDTEEQLCEREEYYLNLYNADLNTDYYNATNKSIQGYPVLRGVNNPNYRGKSFTKDVCARISKTKKKNYLLGITVPWNKGREMSDEFKQKIKDTWDYDKHYGEGSTTKETMSRNRKEKYSRGELVLPVTLPGVSTKISNSLKEGYRLGKYKKLYGKDNPSSRPEVREKISKSVKEAMSRPEVREKSLSKGERLRNDKEFSRKISEGRLGDKNPCYNKIWINNGEYNKRVYKDDFERFYRVEGFIEGRLSKSYGKRKKL